MRESTKKSVDKKIIIINKIIENGKAYNEDNKIVTILNIYQLFHNANSSETSRRDITKLYLEGIPKLKETLKDIAGDKQYDPYEITGYEHRIRYNMGERKKETAAITEETMIQRNLFIAKDHYKTELGRLIGYEVSIALPPIVNGKRNGRFIPIDLIGIEVKDDRCFINLIELKQCVLGDKREAKDLLLRAMYEISTYKLWFTAALNCKEDKLVEAIKTNAEKNGITLTEDNIRQATIQQIIVGDMEMIKEKKEDYFNGIDTSGYIMYAIETTNEFTPSVKCDCKEKLFSLTEVK